MRIIISPAKKMNVDLDGLDFRELPRFLPQTQRLLDRLRGMSYEELKRLWKCSDQIAGLNVRRLEEMDLGRNLTPAILSYEGIQYRYMAPGVFTREELAYIDGHLRILSGFYGVLRPFDGVTPYRLEMQARLQVDGAEDLYAYWGDRLSRSLAAESDTVVNLASREYSLSVIPHLPRRVRLLNCVFGERQGGKIVEKGTQCKMARGEMVRFLAENQVEDLSQMKTFDRLGYRFAPEESGRNTYVFIKRGKSQTMSV